MENPQNEEEEMTKPLTKHGFPFHSRRPYPYSFIGILHRFKCSPKAQSVVCMTLASAIHFAGHEWVRSSTVTLFTSDQYGFTNPAALPLAVGCVSPFSVGLLWVRH